MRTSITYNNNMHTSSIGRVHRVVFAWGDLCLMLNIDTTIIVMIQDPPGSAANIPITSDRTMIVIVVL